MNSNRTQVLAFALVRPDELERRLQERLDALGLGSFIWLLGV